jgi:hypothetical protein
MTSMPDATSPLAPLPADKQQHMLLLFLPLKKNAFPQLAAQKEQGNSSPPDLRATTGVHFAMFHYVPDGAPSFLPVPTFQSAPGKDLLIALSLYDADFEPYISAFTAHPAIAQQLDLLLSGLDETGIVADDDPTSAAAILARGGVEQNNEQFIQLLLRYNFGDPTQSGAGGDALILPSTGQRYSFHATFPGLTVGDVIDNYPNAGTLWPWPPVATAAAPELVAQ